MNTHPPKPPGLCVRRRLPAAVATVLAACGAVAGPLSDHVAAQSGPAGSVYQRGGQAPVAATAASVGAAAEQAGATVEDGGRAERMVAAALAGLGKSESISARVRQLARVGDTVLKGGGRYLQAGTGEEQRFRFESRLSADTEEFDVLEVSDGIFYWSYRKLGPHPPAVTRVDIGRVRERLEKLNVPERANASPYLGGIQRSLALLREWFRFVSVSSTAIDDVPVWSIEGQWDRGQLAALLPAQAEAIKSAAGISAADLPEGMPWSVRLSIGKRELFPFRIEWLAIPGRRPVAAATPEVVAVLELYDVRIGEPVDATAFVYKPATEGLMDTTDSFTNGVLPLRP